MAHVSTQEYWVKDGTGDSKGLRHWTRKFKVIFDAVPEVIDVLNAPGIPGRFAPHPADSTMLARDGNAENLQDDPLIYIVVINYTNDAGIDGDDIDPANRPTDIELDFISFQVPLFYDRNKKAALNSAGDPFDPLWMMEDSRPILRFHRFEHTFDIQRSLDFRNAINLDVFMTVFNPGEVMCMYIKQRRHVENALERWETQYEFQLKGNGQVLSGNGLTDYHGWDAVIPDMGFNQLSPSGSGNRILIEDEKGQPVSVPVRLNGNGLKLHPPSLGPEWTFFRIFEPPYRYQNFVTLSLP